MDQQKSAEKSDKVAYEKPEIKDLGDLFELTAGGSIRGGHDQLYPNNPKAVKCIVTCFS